MSPKHFLADLLGGRHAVCASLSVTYQATSQLNAVAGLLVDFSRLLAGETVYALALEFSVRPVRLPLSSQVIGGR